MASYLWQRGGTWFFQLKPPVDTQNLLGKTPVRVRLPCRTHREALRYARHLAGMAERWLMMMRYRGLARLRFSNLGEDDDPGISIDEIRASHDAIRKRFVDFLIAETTKLGALSAEYEALEKARQAGSPADKEAISQAQKDVFDRSTQAWNDFSQGVITDFGTAFFDMLNAKRANVRTARELDDLMDDYRTSDMEWKSKVNSISMKAKELEAESRTAHETNSKALAEVSNVMRDTAAITTRLLYQGPLLSEAFEDFIKAKRTQLPSDSREPAYFEQRIATFIAIAGDKPIADYTEGDLTLFAGQLQFLPERHTVDPRWRHLSVVEAMKANRGPHDEKLVKSLSYTTIKIGYVGKVKTCIRWLCAHHRVKYPFDYGSTLLPKEARTPLIRFSLESKQLNAVFRECGQNSEEKRPEDVWLPLLAYLTGARLGELVNLQVCDVKQRDGVDIVDLTTRVSGKTGDRNRPMKTRESMRVFALHRVLRELGFIEWVETQRALGHLYLFPDLHEAVRPTGAASKRFQRLFGELHMGKGGPYVFHSLRHSFKDWARSRRVPERTITLQTGHSLDGIAIKYGSKILRTDELREIAAMELEPDLDFQAFKGACPRSAVPPPARMPFREAQIDHGGLSNLPSQRSPRKLRKISRPMESADQIDVLTLRKELRLSQREFCDRFEFTLGALRDWEQGRSKPGRMARATLRSILLGRETTSKVEGMTKAPEGDSAV